jgi:hypothetical protein
VEVGGLQSEASPGKSMRPFPKNKLKANRTGSVARVAEPLPRKHEAEFDGLVPSKNFTLSNVYLT